MSGKGQITKKVNQYDLDGKFIRTWASVQDAANGVKGAISSICRNARGEGNSQANGYLWRYTDGDYFMGTEHCPKYNKQKTREFINDSQTPDFNYLFSPRATR